MSTSGTGPKTYDMHWQQTQVGRRPAGHPRPAAIAAGHPAPPAAGKERVCLRRRR
jgi:hypothetical protein